MKPAKFRACQSAPPGSLRARSAGQADEEVRKEQTKPHARQVSEWSDPNELVNPKSITPKTVHGVSLICPELVTSAKSCAGLSANSKAENIGGLKMKALKNYEDEIRAFCEPGVKWVRTEKLKAQHECKHRALEIFTDEAGGVGEHNQATRVEIVVEIDAKFPQFKKRNIKSVTKVSTIVSGITMAIKTVAELS